MHCPICQQNNQCAMVTGNTVDACWCSKVRFPSEILQLAASDQLNKSCICQACLEKFKSKLNRI